MPSQLMPTHLVPHSPLMQPVLYQGREYFTSHFFHGEYLRNSADASHAKVKCRWHQDYVRLMKALDAFDLYASQGDIVELRWIGKRQAGGADPAYLQQIKDLRLLFQASGFQNIYLLNGTLQAAMSHHLDDLMSQQLSVAVNTAAAKQATRKPLGSHTPLELATRDMTAWLEAGRLFGAPLHIVQQEGAKLIATTHGVDFRPLLLAAPAQDQLPADARMLEPRDLAAGLGYGPNQGARLNRELATLGWQVRVIGGGWEPTPTGKAHCTTHAWSSEYGTKSGYNLKWNIEAVHEALAVAAPTNLDGTVAP